MPTISDYIGDLFIEWRTTNSILGTTGVTPILTPTTGSLIWNGTADWTINSIAPPSISKYNTLTIRNSSTSNNAAIFLTDSNSGNSSIFLNSNFGSTNTSIGAVLTKGQSITLDYDTTLNRWVGYPTEDQRFDQANVAITNGLVLHQNAPLLLKTLFTCAANTSYFYRFILTRPLPVRIMAREVTTAGIAGTTGKVEIYTDVSNSANYRVGVLLASSGSIALTTTGAVSAASATPAYLGAGTYWLQIATNNSVGLRALTNVPNGRDYALGTGDVAVISTSETYSATPQPNRTIVVSGSQTILPLILFR